LRSAAGIGVLSALILKMRGASFGAQVMEAILIPLVAIVLGAGVFWLFVIEPRRKIHD
jgi:hypothetical protein